MRATLVCQGFEETHALGAIVRRNGFVSGFRSNGLETTKVVLQRRPRYLAEVLSVGRPKRTQMIEIVGGSDVLVLEGLPTAVACIASLRRSYTGPIHVDICDSWLRLGGTGRGSGSSLRALISRGVKRILSVMALSYVSKRTDSLSYISELDLRSDLPVLSKNAKCFVIPNGNPSQLHASDGYWERSGPMVVVGDWAYPPNQQMLMAVLELYGALDERPGLHIIGPNLGELPALPTDVKVLGWIDDISQAYKGASCALALTTSGSGVKNKVLEPLSLGVPVIATEDALNGIDAEDHMVLSFKDGLSQKDVDEWLDGVLVHGASKLLAPTWEQNTSEFISYLRNGS